MYLDNYYKMRKQNALTAYGGSFIIDLGLQVISSNGTAYALSRAECGGGDHLMSMCDARDVRTTIPSATGTVLYQQKHIVFGNGDTPVSSSDYSISGDVIPNISCTAVDGGVVGDVTRAIYVFKNNNSTPITIKEVCIFENFGAYATGNYSRKCAVWREVFDEPFEVPAGSLFTYNFEVDYTTGG